MNLTHKINKLTQTLASIPNMSNIINKQFNSTVGNTSSLQGARSNFPASNLHGSALMSSNGSDGDFIIGENKWGGPQNIGR